MKNEIYLKNTLPTNTFSGTSSTNLMFSFEERHTYTKNKTVKFVNLIYLFFNICLFLLRKVSRNLYLLSIKTKRYNEVYNNLNKCIIKVCSFRQQFAPSRGIIRIACLKSTISYSATLLPRRKSVISQQRN